MKRFLLYCSLALVCLLALGYLLQDAVMGSLGRYLVRASDPVSADVVLVLAGDATGMRILTGAKLVEQGYVPYALISGPSGRYGLYECDLAIPFAVKEGYPETYFVHFENDASSTAEEAEEAAPVFRRMGVKHALLLTSDFHTRRAGTAFREAIPDVEFTVIAAPTVGFDPDSWWHSRDGWEVAFYEWMKTIAYWFHL